MKILHLSSENSWRGGEQQIAYLIKEHKKSGVEIVVASKNKSPFSTFCEEENFKLFELSFNGSFDFKSAQSIAQICRTQQVDFIHAHSGKSHALAVLSNVIFGAKTKVILSRRVDFPIKNNAWAKWKYNHKSVKKIICVSEAIKNILSKKITQKEKLITIHSGIDLEKFDPEFTSNFLRKKYNVEEKFILIGNTSALAPHKDYFTFIDTCDVLVNEGIDAKFFIIGSGPMEKEIRDYVFKKDLNRHIIFTGFIDNIQEVLPELDIFLITSETEGLGTSIIDSFASKVPVVGTAAGGIPELVIHEKTGLLSPIKNSRDLAKNIIRLIENKDLKSNLIAGASAHLLNFSKEKTAAKTLAVYQNILDN